MTTPKPKDDPNAAERRAWGPGEFEIEKATDDPSVTPAVATDKP